jgi:lipoic acid synthetase
MSEPESMRRPDWLRVRAPSTTLATDVASTLKGLHLHTICESGSCPNWGECWDRGTATFMILGNVCSRSCGFCAVKTGLPVEQDPDEPRRLAEAVRRMNLSYVVVTGVSRDELPDGGASAYAETIRCIREAVPQCRVETLIPDFKGNWKALQLVLDAGPDVLNHNSETVPRLYPKVRPQARYERTLELLRRASAQGAYTKSGLILGLGEEGGEILATMRDLLDHGVRILTLGQYLSPSPEHLPVARWVEPQEFEELREAALEMGFDYCESGPLVRSSYHAESHYRLSGAERWVPGKIGP